MKKLLTIILLLLLIPMAYSFSAETRSITTKIYPDEAAQYQITIFNDGTTTHRYTVNLDGDFRWILEANPTILMLPPNKTGVINLTIYPKKSSLLNGQLNYGGYNIPIVVKEEETNKINRKNLFIYISSYYLPGISYKPVIKITPEYEQEVDPRQPFILGLTISNKNIINVSNLRLVIDSELFHKEVLMNFNPLETKHIELVFELDPKTTPKRYTFLIKAIYNNESLVEDERSITIKPYKAIDIKKTQFMHGLLIDTTRINITNNGNTEQEIFIPYKSWIGKEIITKHPEIVERNNTKGFLINLKVGETKTIEIKTYYWPIALIVLIAIIAIIVYYLTRSPIVIEKEAKAISRGEGVSEIKVVLRVRNRSLKPIQGIIVNDFIPKIASIDKEYKYVGTMPPSRIASHPGFGERITWEIDVMEPYEERLLTYKIKTKLNVLGTLTLPKAKVRITHKGKTRVVTSNNPKIY